MGLSLRFGRSVHFGAERAFREEDVLRTFSWCAVVPCARLALFFDLARVQRPEFRRRNTSRTLQHTGVTLFLSSFDEVWMSSPARRFEIICTVYFPF